MPGLHDISERLVPSEVYHYEEPELDVEQSVGNGPTTSITGSPQRLILVQKSNWILVLAQS